MGIGGLGMGELILLFLVVLLLFGAKRLPEIGSSLGKGIREFKGSVREIEHEIKSSDAPPKVTPSPSPTENREPRKLSDVSSDAGSGDAEPGAQGEDSR
jgi:sec-independent protein translocase protein TatA